MIDEIENQREREREGMHITFAAYKSAPGRVDDSWVGEGGQRGHVATFDVHHTRFKSPFPDQSKPPSSRCV